MEQRPLRLGDIVDDYCTRERRITNHAVVAIVEDAIRQTRCTTCDAEHVYRGAREPRLRKKNSELYDQVLANVNGNPTETPAHNASAEQIDPEQGEAIETDEDAAPASDDADIWPGHRRLIRASLPRSENEPPPPRPIPEFTMHQRPPSRPARGFRFRGPASGGGFGNGNPNANGNGNGNSFNQGRPGRSGRHRGKKRPR